MYKVCFADDEIMNHRLLEKLVDWDKYGFQIAGTATDGVEALKLYEEEKPDLFLIDIKMPCMDGLECAKLIRAVDRRIKIVIVSAYSEFTYAQKAIQYGVQDFVVKPISRIVINALVEKMKELLDRESHVQENDSHTDTFIRMQKEIYDGNMEKLLCLQQYDLFFERIRQIAFLRIFEKEGSLIKWELTERLMLILEKTVRSMGTKGEVVTGDCGKIFLLIYDETSVQEILDRWKESEHYIIDIFVSGRKAERKELCYYLEQSCCGENPGFYKRTGSTFEGDLKDCFKKDGRIEANVVFGDLDLHKEKDRLKEYFETFILECRKENISPKVLKNTVLDSLVLLKLRLKDYFGEDAFYMLRDVKISELKEIDKAVYLQQYITGILDKLFMWIHEVKEEESREKQIIKKADQYARENFMRADFSAQDAADYIGLSKNYFVTIYKEHAGRGFWDYVTELRIEKARRFLRSTDWTISYIARCVGYESEYHFSRKFKDIMGMPPSGYRKYEQRAMEHE